MFPQKFVSLFFPVVSNKKANKQTKNSSHAKRWSIIGSEGFLEFIYIFFSKTFSLKEKNVRLHLTQPSLLLYYLKSDKKSIKIVPSATWALEVG